MKIESCKRKNKWKKNDGSLTVEATLIMPLILMVILFFLYFFQVLLVHERVSTGLWETAKEISQYGYIYAESINTTGTEESGQTQETEELGAGQGTNETDGNVQNNTVAVQLEKPMDTSSVTEENAEIDTRKQLMKSDQQDAQKKSQCMQAAGRYIGGLLTGERMKSYVSDGFVQAVCLKNKISYETEAFFEGDKIELVASYDIKIPLFCMVLPEIHMIQKVDTRAFTGTTKIGEDDIENNDRTVYVTRTGTVYHTTLNCSHLNLHIETLLFEQVANRRNENGAKYYPCEHCVRNVQMSAADTAYITTDGNRYHNKLNCSGLTRDVKEVKLSEIAGYRACADCGN